MSRAFCLALLCSLVSFVPLRADPPFKFPEGQCPHGELKYIQGVPVLTVDGTPDEIGAAVGLLALRPAKRMAGFPDDMLNEFYLSIFREPLLHAGQHMVNHFSPNFRSELEAMVHSAQVDRDRIVLGNTMFDLKKIIACSALMVEPGRSSTGGTLMGRNLDYPSLGYAHEFTLVTVYRPQGAKHNYAIVGFPGLMGCLSGMNDAGLAVAILEVGLVKIGEKRFDPHGTPYGLCYRQVLEECSTIAEAKAMLEKMKRTGLSNLVVADREGVATFEISPERVVVRHGTQGTCVCTNHFCTNELKPEVNLNFFNTYGRFDSLTKMAEVDRKLGPSDLQLALHAASFKTWTLQTMIFESATLRLRLSAGTIPSSAGEMKVVELGPLFGSK